MKIYEKGEDGNHTLSDYFNLDSMKLLNDKKNDHNNRNKDGNENKKKKKSKQKILLFSNALFIPKN